MGFRVYFGLCCVVLGGFNTRAQPTFDFSYYEEKFQEWQHEFQVKFEDAEEYLHRLNIFRTNDVFITQHNDEHKNLKLAHNEFSHLSWEEFRSSYKGYRIEPEYLAQRLQKRDNTTTLLRGPLNELPENVDWVEKGGVTPVKNQGQCGSCWAFSTTGAVEGATFVTSKTLVDLSEQELVDCDHDGDRGCGGGLMDHAFNWIHQHGGICREQDYSYHAVQEQCQHTCKSVATVESFQDVNPNDEAALKVAVAQQPVSVAIEADQPLFQFYHSGVFSRSCGTKLDHGVLVVGYGVSEEGKKYWKVKNSWGPSWGLDGYILIERENGPPEGLCGIAMVPSYPKARLTSDFASLATPATNVQSAARIKQCGDPKSSAIKFQSLTINPSEPKRGKEVHFGGDGAVEDGFSASEFDLDVKLDGHLVYTHEGSMCGKTHIPLPLGLGHLDVNGFSCPTIKGNFKDIGMDVKLPVFAPNGDYEIQLTGTSNSKTLFCVHVQLDLSVDNSTYVSRVFEPFIN